MKGSEESTPRPRDSSSMAHIIYLRIKKFYFLSVHLVVVSFFFLFLVCAFPQFMLGRIILFIPVARFFRFSGIFTFFLYMYEKHNLY